MAFTRLRPILVIVLSLLLMAFQKTQGSQFDILPPNTRVQQVTAQNYANFISYDPTQEQNLQHILLLFCRNNDSLSYQARQIYELLAVRHGKHTKFGFVDIHQDEEIKVAFGVEAIPYTFFIDLQTQRVYKLDTLESDTRLNHLLSNKKDWQKMGTQFQLPTRPSSKTQLYLSYVTKDISRFYRLFLKGYVYVVIFPLTGKVYTPSYWHRVAVLAITGLFVLLLGKMIKEKVCRRQEKEKEV